MLLGTRLAERHARTREQALRDAARRVWRIADEVKDRYGLDAFEVDPAAFGTRVELERRTPITDNQLARYDRELARLRGLLDVGDTAAHDPERHHQLQQRRAEIDELRELMADERSRSTNRSPEQRRAGELRELGD